MNRSQRKVRPVDPLSHRVMVELSDLEQVHERVGPADDLDGAVGIQNGLQAHPCGDACLVESVQGVDALSGKRRSRLPFAGMLIRDESHRRRVGVAAGEKIQVCERASATFGENLDVIPVAMQGLDHVSGEAMLSISRLVGVRSERQQDALPRAGRLAAICF